MCVETSRRELDPQWRVQRFRSAALFRRRFAHKRFQGGNPNKNKRETNRVLGRKTTSNTSLKLKKFAAEYNGNIISWFSVGRRDYDSRLKAEISFSVGRTG